MADLSFKTKKKTRKTIKFTLDDHEFSFKPPKSASMVLPMVLDGTSEAKAGLDWLGTGLGEEDNKVLIDRLKDPGDDFDIEDLGPIIESLIAEMGGNPTS